MLRPTLLLTLLTLVTTLTPPAHGLPYARKTPTPFHSIHSLHSPATHEEYDSSSHTFRARHNVDHADFRGRTRLSYDVTLPGDTLRLDHEPSVLDVACATSSTRTSLSILTSDTRGVAGWEDSARVVGGPHFTCGSPIMVRLVASPTSPRVFEAAGIVVWDVVASNVTDVFQHAHIVFEHFPADQVANNPEDHPEDAVAAVGAVPRIGTRAADGSLAPRVLVEKTFEIFKFNYDEDDDIAEDFEVGFGPLTCFNCYAYMSAGAKFELTVENFWIEKFEFVVRGEAALNGDVVIENPDWTENMNEDHSFDIGGEIPGIAWIFAAAGVPIHIQPNYRLQGMAKAMGTLQMRITAGLTVTASAEFGVRYVNNRWSLIMSPAWGLDVRKPQYFFEQKDLTLKAYVQPSLTVMFWQTVGIGVVAKPYIGYELVDNAGNPINSAAPQNDGELPLPDDPVVGSLEDIPDNVQARPDAVDFAPFQVTSTTSTITLGWIPPTTTPGASTPTVYALDYYECGLWPLPCAVTTNPWITFAEDVSATPDSDGNLRMVMGPLESDQGYGVRMKAGSVRGWGDYSPQVVVSTSDGSPSIDSVYSPFAGSSWGTGDVVPVGWGHSSLSPSSTVSIELWESISLWPDKRIETLATGVQATSGFANVTLSYDLSSGSNYYIKVVGAGDEAESGEFSIRFVSSPSNGRYIVRVNSASGLPSSSPDPYVRVEVSGYSSAETDYVSNSNNPTWNQAFVFGIEMPVARAASRTVTLIVYDSNFGTDDELARTTVSCPFTALDTACTLASTSLSPQGTINVVIELQSVSGANSRVLDAATMNQEPEGRGLGSAVSVRNENSCPPDDAAYQLSFGLSFSARVADVQIPDSVPLVGGFQLFPGGELGGVVAIPPTKFQCGEACSGCRKELIEKAETVSGENALWVAPDLQRRPSKNAILEQRRKEKLTQILIVVIVVSILFCCCAGFGMYCWYQRRRKAEKRRSRHSPAPPPSSRGTEMVENRSRGRRRSSSSSGDWWNPMSKIHAPWMSSSSDR